MSAHPTFSVLIPAYNAEAVIDRAVRSALSQSVSAQVVVCNDGSTDGTTRALAQYSQQIALVTQPNRGLTAARNAALDVASGDYVVLLDADDEWCEHRLQGLREVIEKSSDDTVIATSDAVVVGPGGSTRRYYANVSWPSPGKQPVSILEQNFIFGGAAVNRSALIGIDGFLSTVTHDSEYATWVKLILDGGRAALDTDATAIYNQGPMTLSSRRVATHQMVIEIMDAVLQREGLSPRQRAAAGSRRQESEVRRDVAATLESLDNGSPRLRPSAIAASGHRELAWWKRALFRCVAASPSLARAAWRATPPDHRPRPR